MSDNRNSLFNRIILPGVLNFVWRGNVYLVIFYRLIVFCGLMALHSGKKSVYLALV